MDISIENRRAECVVSFSRFKVALNLVPGINALLRNEPTEETDAMRAGTAWEIIVHRLLRQALPDWYTVRACFGFVDPARKFGGTADYWLPHHRHELGPAVVEIKFLAVQEWERVQKWEQIPNHYLPQLEGEMRAIHAHHCYLVLFKVRGDWSAEAAHQWLERLVARRDKPLFVPDSMLVVWHYVRNDPLWEWMVRQLCVFRYLREHGQCEYDWRRHGSVKRCNEQLADLRERFGTPDTKVLFEVNGPFSRLCRVVDLAHLQ